ncbi:MAG: family 10 glycosylhydrolase [Clostridiaceae bacterium]|nr:family 10 glycosylhydrolase [Clostridiaceae bacterium]
MKKSVFFICVMPVLSLFLFIVPVLSACTPWEPYKQYIPKEMPVTTRHLRGLWISTVLNLDWPSAETRDLKDNEARIEKSKEELIFILDKAVEMNMNAVFFQVSPEGDALYQSELVPWSRYLTGTFGKNPGFDPLAFAIEEAHKRNLELHAWFNPYRVSMYTNSQTRQSLNIEKSVYKEHPDWIRAAMSRYVVDPGIPEARKWVISRVMEVVRNYDIDGIHFDDYFYYERTIGELKDQSTYKKYNQDEFDNIEDWRRNNTYLLVKELSKEINSAKSWVKFGISPGGVWANKKDGYPEGSNTKSPYTNYDINFADTKKWVEEELIDYIAPQIYFSFANSSASYGELASWWAGIVKNRNVHLYIGQAFYKINDDSDLYFKGNNVLKEFPSQLIFNAAQPYIMGSILFRAKNLTDSQKQPIVSLIKNELWQTKALVPVMEWKGGAPPRKPEVGTIEAYDDGVKITWHNNDPNTVYYAIYRFDKNTENYAESNTFTKNLIATVRKETGKTTIFYDDAIKTPDQAQYIVTALDRLHHESEGLIIGTSHSAYFVDISQNYLWAKEAVDSLYERKAFPGSESGLFQPHEKAKRGDFVVATIRTLGLFSEFDENFLDVFEDDYYYDEIGISKKLGIIGGKYFHPDEYITREEMIVILARALATSEYGIEPVNERILKQYADESEISSHARPAVAIMAKYGYVQGNNGCIFPKKFATRAEMSVILHRILQDIEQ